MKQAINFLSRYRHGGDSYHGSIMLVGWGAVFLALLLWGIGQYALYNNDKGKLKSLKDNQQLIVKQMSMTNKLPIKDTNQPLMSSIAVLSKTNQQKQDFLRLIQMPKRSALVALLSDISRSYIDGTVIEYLHIKDEKLLHYRGSALQPALVPNVVEGLNAVKAFKKEDLIKIKVKRTKPEKHHVQFSIQAQ